MGGSHTSGGDGAGGHLGGGDSPEDESADSESSESEEEDEDEWGEEEDDEDALAARRAQRWTRKAFELAQGGKMEEAAEAFSEAVAATPADAPYRASLLINAGSFLAFSGRAREALGPLREALGLAPDDARALHALGNALHQCEASGDALEVYAKALEASPERDFPPNAPLLNNVATILLNLGERKLAVRMLERSLRIEPSAPGTLFNLAMAEYSDALETVRARPVSGGDVVLETRLVRASRAAQNEDAMRRVVALLDRAEPHAPAGSALRERVLALRGVAASAVPGRESHARLDLEDVLAHGAEHARDPKRRANALLELAHLSPPNDKEHILREVLDLLRDAAADSSPRLAAKRHKKRRHAKQQDAKVLALGQPRDAGLSLRAIARAELANALVDRDDLDAGFSSFFAAAHDGLGAAIALSHSPQAAKLRDADPHRFDDLLNLVCRNDAFAAIQALTSALAPNPPQTSSAN